MCEKNKRNRESGFSLIELLIVIVMLTIVTASIFTLLNNSLRVTNTSTQMTEAQQNLRTGQEYITRDLYNTGDNLIGVRPMIKSAFVDTYLSKAAIPHPDFPANPSLASFTVTGMLRSDEAPAGIVPIEFPSEVGLTLRPGTDRITILTTPDPDNAFTDIQTPLTGVTNNTTSEIYVSAADALNVNAGEIYLLVNADNQGDNIGSAFVEITSVNPNGTIEFASGSDVFGLNDGVINLVTDNKDDARLILRRVWLVHYFVDSGDRLIRRVFGRRDTTPPNVGRAFTEYVIAENVTDLSFEYILDVFSANLTTQLDTTDLLEDVRQVRVGFVTETSRPVINNDNQTVSNFAIISPRNLQFRRALVPN